MPLSKPTENLKIAILIPCYKRPEYTRKCLKSIFSEKYTNVDFYVVDDGSNDSTKDIILEEMQYGSPIIPKFNSITVGLRNIVIDFLNTVKEEDYDLIGKIDNDCLVPSQWLNKIISVFQNSDADILSPNVMPSNAAFSYGKDDKDNKGYRPAEIVGGLWFMKTSLIKDMYFEKVETDGLSGAIAVLRQIVTENDVNIGWIPDVIIEDVGHWSGKHPEHIKSQDHEYYSKEVGRKIAWSST